MACDFFTVETIRLQTLYVFFFIEVGTRHIHIADVTSHPTRAWVTQQARQFIWTLQTQEQRFTHLIRDNDGKYGAAFDAIFTSEGLEVVRTPVRAPRANAYAERWVRSVREECLDQLLILNETHLRYVLHEYECFFNTARPHQGIGQGFPIHLRKAQSAGQLNGAIGSEVCSTTTIEQPNSWETPARIRFFATTTSVMDKGDAFHRRCYPP